MSVIHEAGDPHTAKALRDYADLPGPRGIPVFGNAFQIDAPRLHQQLDQWSREHGPLFRLTIGQRRLLV